MENRPRGREKYVSGEAKRVEKRGAGLSGGPVGRQDGYSGRTGGTGGMGGGAQPERSGGGRSPIGIIIALIIALMGGGGFGLSSLFGGGDDTQSTNDSTGNAGSLLQMLGSSGGMFTNNGSVSEGWAAGNNTGRLNTSVAQGARAKRTDILGGGNDKVTLMVYMCGTDLESRSGMATSDIQEMMNARFGGNIDLLIYTGGCKQWRNNIVSSRVNQIYKVENGSLRCVVDNDGSDPMTKPATLARYIRYCTKNYPANRYGLILWDHGGGSVSGYGYDEKNASAGSMTLKGINDALSAAGTTFDFIGYDACLMATLENALMAEKYADYLIASEETEPGIGWYYTNWLTKLSENTSMPTTEIGKNIIDDFVSACAQKCRGQKTTLSIIDLAELKATVPDKLNSFSRSTSELINNNNFKTVSDARSNTREFAPSNKLDQVDIIHLAYNLDTTEGKELASALLGAVKYNRTSAEMTNSYGLSIYFPYRKTSKLDAAVAAYNAIGVDSEYARCIQSFASYEVSGQAAAGGGSSPFDTLFGDGAAEAVPSGGLAELLGTLLGGDFGGVSGLDASNSGFFGRSMDVDKTVDYLSKNRFDPSALVWADNGEHNVIKLSEQQWSMVHDLQLNVFADDGEGYIDLGLDNVCEFTDDGELIGEFDGTWLAVDGQPVAYYYVDSTYDGDKYTITGRIPVLLNGERANLIVVFTDSEPRGYIAGAYTEYINGETDTAAKNMTELTEGDTIDFVCDYYSYSGEYQNSYMLGEQLIYNGNHEISNVPLDNKTTASYMFTDMYGAEYWTPGM